MTENELAAALFKIRDIAPDLYGAIINIVRWTLKSLGIK